MNYVISSALVEELRLPVKQRYLFDELIKKKLNLKGRVLFFLTLEELMTNEKWQQLLLATRELQGIVLWDVNHQLNAYFSELFELLKTQQRLSRLLITHKKALLAEWVYRLVQAQATKLTAKHILHAELLGDNTLKIISCNFTVFKLKWRQIPPFLGWSKIKMANFLLDEQGANLRWQAAKLRFNLAYFANFSEQAQEQLVTRMLKQSQHIGTWMKKFRQQKGVRQIEIKGLCERQLRRYEQNQQKPTLKALEKISNSFKLPLQEYLQQLEAVRKQ